MLQPRPANSSCWRSFVFCWINTTALEGDRVDNSLSENLLKLYMVVAWKRDSNLPTSTLDFLTPILVCAQSATWATNFSPE